MGTESTTAQVTPAEFTRSMIDLAQDKGAKLTIASAESLAFEADGVALKCVRAVDEKGETLEIPATDIVLAAGPWTARLASKLLGTRAGAALDIEPRCAIALSAPRPLTDYQNHAIYSGCSTSVIFRPSTPITPHALFTELTLPSGISVSPEIYPRPDGTVYMCGDHTDPLRPRPLPTRAADVTPSPHAVKNQTERLKWLGGRGFDDVQVEVEQACFRPESRRGKPVIGELAKGVYIASGHSVWGICNGPGTGQCMVRIICSIRRWMLTMCGGGTHLGRCDHFSEYPFPCTVNRMSTI